MRTKVALGLMVALLLAPALRHLGTSTAPLAKDEPSGPRITSPASDVPHQARRSSLSATQPSHAVEAGLLAAVEGETDADRRSEALEGAAGSVSDADLRAVLDSLVSNTRPAAAELGLLLVRRWAEADAPAAAAWAAQLPQCPMYRAALEQVAIAWASTDLAAATGWMEALPDDDAKLAAALNLAYEAARSEPVKALEVASGLAATPARDDLLVHAISQWGGADPATATDWAAKVFDASLRQRLLAATAIAAAERDGAAAATLAANVLDAGQEQDRASVSIVQRWAQASPGAAAAWVSQFPDNSARETATQNLVALWTLQDSEAAGNWVRELPEESLRQVGSVAYAQALVERDRISAAVPTAGPAVGLGNGHLIP